VDDPTRRFIALYDAHYRRVLGYALLRAEPAAAQDVVSETFLIAWRRLGDVPETALPWLLGVARNLLRRDRDMGRRDQSLARRIAALAAWLRAAIRPKPDPQTPAASDPEPGFGPPDAEELLFATAAELLDWPVPHGVRAAAFKILAGVDGARLLGRVTDPIGRTGTGVAFPESSEGDRVFIVAPATAELLAMQYIPRDPARFGVRVPAGTATLSVTTVESGWVDTLGQRP
jgi:hypothetical protein